MSTKKTKKFDTFVAIDWSGARMPERSRAIALAWCHVGKEAPTVLDHPLSRVDICEWLSRRINTAERCLVGIDCNFGYAEMIGREQFGEEYDYLTLWQAVEDSSAHLTNYFAEGFWRHEIYGRHFWTSGARPAHCREVQQRVTEIVCREKGYGHPESPFKLIGPKQVGKGGLAGMRMLYDLKRTFDKKISVWPFESHTDEARMMIAEIYPRLFLKAAGFGQAKIRDMSGLNQALSFFNSRPLQSNLDLTDHVTDALVASAGLRALAGAGIPAEILKPPKMTPAVASREGWILGV